MRLDHVGLAAPDLDRATEAWRAAGFAPGPASQGGGLASRRVMLARGYVELLAVADPALASATLPRFLARYAGIHVLTLAVDDAAGALAHLRRAGFAAAISASERPADAGGGTARFLRIPLAEAEPRLQLLQHLTPDLVWQPALLAHPNHAVALEAVVMAADDPAALAARLARAAGSALVPDPLGGYALALDAGAVRILPQAALGVVFPGLPVPSLPFIAGLVLRTDDACAAVARLGAARPVPGGWLAEAAGAGLLFIA